MTCKLCRQPFQFSQQEQNFIKKISPRVKNQQYLFNPPQYCPRCRAMRRCSFRNEHTLYHRKCDLTGKEFISVFPQNSKYKVYEPKAWWSDQWDPLQYGKEYDFNKSFFEQFQELQATVPRLGMVSLGNENSDYTNYVSYLKNCYLIFTADYNQDCLYGIWIEHSKDSVDNLLLDHSELSYYSFFSQNIYNSSFILCSSQCTDSAFLYDCKGCNHCFLSTGLRNKQYYIKNQAYSKTAYEALMAQWNLGSYITQLSLKKEFLQMIQAQPKLFIQKTGRINDSTGNLLSNTENCIDCFDLKHGKDCMYVQAAIDVKDVQHSSYLLGEFGYENCEGAPIPYQSACNINSYTGNNLWYTDTCMNNCSNCFGCIGLRHQEYCILNKSYSKEDYEQLVTKIITQMIQNQEWGEFFPFSLSPFAFNETTAYEHFPLTKDQAIAIGMKWKDDIVTSKHYGESYIPPDAIENVSDEITQKILSCDQCHKQYRVIQQELKFYRQQNLPIPHHCFDCRHRERVSWKNGWNLWDRACFKCQQPIRTTYAPDRPEIVYCEACYLETIH